LPAGAGASSPLVPRLLDAVDGAGNAAAFLIFNVFSRASDATSLRLTADGAVTAAKALYAARSVALTPGAELGRDTVDGAKEAVAPAGFESGRAILATKLHGGSDVAETLLLAVATCVRATRPLLPLVNFAVNGAWGGVALFVPISVDACFATVLRSNNGGAGLVPEARATSLRAFGPVSPLGQLAVDGA